MTNLITNIVTNAISPPTGHEGIKPEQWFQLLISILQIGGGFVAGYLTHRFTSKQNKEARDVAAKLARDTRLADYEAFLLEWEQRIERSSPEEIANVYFREGQALFRSRAALVRRDFTDRIEFNRRDAALCRLTPDQVRRDSTRDARNVLADAIRTLIEYVQAA